MAIKPTKTKKTTKPMKTKKQINPTSRVKIVKPVKPVKPTKLTAVTATKTNLDLLLETRKDAYKETKLTLGPCYSGFDKLKAFAEKAKVPFFTVWANKGCGLCTKFEGNLIAKPFTDYMKKSGILFWFGYSGDAAKEDRATGKAWSKHGRLSKFPFARLYTQDGKTDVAESGSWWNGGKSGDDGAKVLVGKLTALLA